MLKLIALSLVQCLLLTCSQVFLKFALARIGGFSFSWAYLRELFVNWQLACSGITIAAASLIWFYIIKHFDFSQAYPMISISYVFGMLAAMLIFREAIPVTRWIGVALIISGVILVAKQ